MFQLFESTRIDKASLLETHVFVIQLYFVLMYNSVELKNNSRRMFLWTILLLLKPKMIIVLFYSFKRCCCQRAHTALMTELGKQFWQSCEIIVTRGRVGYHRFNYIEYLRLKKQINNTT